MARFSLKQLTLVLAFFGFASAAFAQYVWIDEKGVKQFSDMPPPASVPKKSILKEPSGAVRSAAPEPTEAPALADKASAKAPMTLAERNAEFQKRRTEQAEKDKKDAAAAKQAAEKSKNCERARNYQRALESGQRIAKTDKNGERAFLSDEQRAQEVREANRILSECK
jgi:hypothetical protein